MIVRLKYPSTGAVSSVMANSDALFVLGFNFNECALTCDANNLVFSFTNNAKVTIKGLFELSKNISPKTLVVQEANGKKWSLKSLKNHVSVCREWATEVCEIPDDDAPTP